MYDDEYEGQGGSYLMDSKTGKRTRLDDPIKEHPDGNRARPAEESPAPAPEPAPSVAPGKKNATPSTAEQGV